MANYNVAPYYDTTEDEYAKNYKRILAYPGRNPQARELTVSQGLTLKHLETFSKTLFSDGYIISGCELIVSGTTATITAGQVYAGGYVHTIPDTTITITGVGTEVIGMKITEEIVTENDDITLRDPAQGYTNYSHPGMHRVKSVVSFVVNDDTAIPMWTLIDGTLQTSATNTDSSLYKILAERTYDESGNYRIYGLDVAYSTEVDASTLEFMITPGKAYVEGWQILRPSNTFINISKALDYRTTLNEPHVFHTGTNLYELIHQPAKEITTVTATVQVGNGTSTGESVVKGVPGSSDPLSHESVSEIVEVWDSGHGAYASGTDYILSANSVDWSPSGAEPTQGNTYYVTYKYIKDMVENTDYQLTESSNTWYIDFSLTGDDPVDSTTFFVDYNWYLARYDIIYLNKDNNIGTITGKSDAPDTVTPPDYYINVLPLALIYFNPNSTTVEITAYDNYRLSMEDLHQLYQRVVADEYDIATLDLNKQVQEQESSIYLRGILTDNFLTLDKTDIGSVNFTANIDLVFNWLQLASTETISDLNVNTTPSTVTVSNELFAHLPYTETSAISQTYATDFININPYATFQRLAIITTTPPKYYWTKNEYYNTELEQVIPTQVIRINRTTHSYIHPPQWRQHIHEIAGITTTVQTRIVSQLNRNQVVSVSYAGERIITYIPTISVTLKGKNFFPESDNLTLYVNNKQTTMTAVAPTTTGTNVGTIKSDVDGNIEATFTMPNNTKTGIISIKVKNNDNLAYYDFDAKGISKLYDIQDTNIEGIIETITTTRHITVIDPVAQTFSFDTDTFVSKIDLYFKEKSATDPIIVQVRGVENGYPTQTVFFDTILNPADVNISADASVATTIDFNQPVFCKANKEYAITLTTTSNDYYIWYAKGGGTDVLTSAFVNTQPYTAGVLFTSSNNSTWTAMQDSDLKFILYKAQFTASTDYYLYFAELTGMTAFSRFLLAIEEIYLPSTTIKWEYSVDSGTTWTLFYPNDIRQTDIGSTTTKILVRATLNTTDTALTPIIRIDPVNLISWLYDTSGDYLTVTTDTTQTPYSEVKMQYKGWQPSGTTVTPYFSTDGGSTWNALTLDNSYQVNDYFWQYEYSKKITADAPTLTASNATAQTSGGTLADATYYYVFTATNSQGETTGCTEFNVVVSGGSGAGSIDFDLSSAFDTHTTGFKVYRATATGSETKKYAISSTPASWTDDGSDTGVSTDIPPTNNSAFYTVNSFKGKLALTTANQTVTPRVIDFVSVFKEAIP